MIEQSGDATTAQLTSDSHNIGCEVKLHLLPLSGSLRHPRRLRSSQIVARFGVMFARSDA